MGSQPPSRERCDFPRLPIERRSRSRLTDGTSLVRLRLWLAMLGLALVPMLGVVLLGSAVPSEAVESNDARRAWATATAAAELMARERDIETRLLAAAADPAIGRLLDGVSGQAERQAADRLVASLRGTDGSVVRGVCVSDGGEATRLSGGSGEPAGTGCSSRSLATRAQSLEPGGVARSTAAGADGSPPAAARDRAAVGPPS